MTSLVSPHLQCFKCFSLNLLMIFLFFHIILALSFFFFAGHASSPPKLVGNGHAGRDRFFCYFTQARHCLRQGCCWVYEIVNRISVRQLLEGCSFWGFGLFLAIVLVFLAIKTRWQKIKKQSGFFKVKLKSAIWASEWPRRSNLSSDLKFLTQIAYDSMMNLA